MSTAILQDVSVSAKSANGKTGPMPTISRPIETTCPTTCAFLPKKLGGNGLCYANGRINGITKKYSADMTVTDVAAKINAGKAKDARYIRDRVVGDIIAPDTARDAATETADVDYVLNMAEVARLTGLTAYGYTHAYDLLSEVDVLAIAASGYVLNASCNTVEDIERAVALGLPTTYAGDDLADGDVIAGRRIVTCPEQTGKAPDCATCGLCAKPNRAATVRFLIH